MTMSGFLLLLVKGNLALGAAIVLVSLIRRPLRAQFGAPIAYAIWLLVPIAGVASLLPPREVPAPAHVASVHVPAPALVTGYVPPSTLNAIEQFARDSVLPPLTPMKPVGSSVEMFDISRLLFAAWVLGLLFMAAHLTRGQIRFSAAVRRGQAGPAVLGFFRPRIVTPGGFQEQFTPQEQSAILAHECVHLARQDARINALVALLRCFCWFNPLIHLGARWLRIDQELACDAITVSGAVSRRDYSMAMLKSQAMIGLLPFGCNWPGPQHPLVERIALLQRKPPGAARRCAGISLVLLTAASAGLGAWAAQPPVAAKSMATGQPRMALSTPSAIGAAQDQTTGNLGQPAANPAGGGNDASKDVPGTAVFAAPVAGTLARATPNPVVITNAEEALPPTTESSTATPNQVATSQAARVQTDGPATTSADPPVQPPPPAVALYNQPVAPPIAHDLAVGPVQAGLGTPPATPPNFDPNEPYEIRRCTGTVTGRATSSKTIQIGGISCVGYGNGLPTPGVWAGVTVGGDEGYVFNLGRPCKGPRTLWAAMASASVSSCMGVTMTVELANPADASKMPLGKLVRLKGDFRFILQNKVQYLLMQNARVLYTDPFGR
jgi:beta-lactamase regulating signal transducer with metallopeptidase domain